MVRFNSGFHQKRLGGKITSASINLGCTKGRASITRRLKVNVMNTHMYTKKYNNYRFNNTRRNYR